MVYNLPKREGTLMNNHNFGSHLVSVRMRSGMTRFDLARKLGINYITIAKWESGELKPTADELLLLAAAFGTTPEVLLSGKPFNVVRTANQPVAPAISKPAPAAREAITEKKAPEVAKAAESAPIRIL
jgi:transcriptional regulator with XRE-family HTH domain